jgi:branched-chain amino acid transport system permease protein
MLALQLTVNGLVQGCEYSLVALGFALILYATGTFHFAHGAVFTWGTYIVYLASVDAHLPIVVAAVAASIACAVLGCLIEVLIYRPVRKRSGSPMAVVVASLGALIFLSNLAQLIFGADEKLVGQWSLTHLFSIGTVHIEMAQLIPVVCGLGLSGLVVVFLYATRPGLLIRGVSANVTRSEILGVRPQRIGLMTVAIGSALLGPAAAMIVLDQGVTPSAGLDIVLVAGIATIAGGIRRPVASVGAAIILAVAESLSIWKISSDWQEAVGYGLLLVLIAWRPNGVFGVRTVAELRGG